MFELMKIRYFMLFGFITTIIVLFGSFTVLNDESLFTLILSYTILGAFPLLWFGIQLKKQRTKLSDILYIKDVNQSIPDILLLTLTLIIFSLGAFWLTCYTLSPVFPNYVTFLLQEEELFPDGGISFLLMAIYISLIGPVVEELIFRGLLLKRLAAKFSIVISIIVTNGIFAIFHSDIIGAFMFGFILSLLYLKSGNLLLPIMIHVLNNSIATILEIVHLPLPDFLDIVMIEQLPDVMIPNLIMLIITIPVLAIYIRRNIDVLSQ